MGRVQRLRDVRPSDGDRPFHIQSWSLLGGIETPEKIVILAHLGD